MLNHKDFERLLIQLRELISFQTIAGCSDENIQGIKFISSFLRGSGFKVKISGKNEIEQPVIVAHRKSLSSEHKLLIYGHYDVAKVDQSEDWVSEDPFRPEIIGNRLFGRGVADNKGILLTRMIALNNLVHSGQPLPEILWLIQGKEEVDYPCEITHRIFKEKIAEFGKATYLDETGFNDMDTDEPILFLWTKNKTSVSDSISQQLISLVGIDRVEDRHLKKLNGGDNCPLLNALPCDAVYLGFGPNDRLHNIHRADESLDVGRLKNHFSDFSKFITAYAIQ